MKDTWEDSKPRDGEQAIEGVSAPTPPSPPSHPARSCARFGTSQDSSGMVYCRMCRCEYHGEYCGELPLIRVRRNPRRREQAVEDTPVAKKPSTSVLAFRYQGAISSRAVSAVPDPLPPPHAAPQAAPSAAHWSPTPAPPPAPLRGVLAKLLAAAVSLYCLARVYSRWRLFARTEGRR